MTYSFCLVLVRLEEFKTLSVHLELSRAFFSQSPDVVKGFRVSERQRDLPCARGTYLVASKMSSNFFFKAAGSDNGQFDSS